MSYSQLIEKLFLVNLQGGSKYGLKNMQALDSLFDHPSQKFCSIHVAGTNGKGSVTTKIASALEFSGKRVGLYTSPHISTFRERIQINGKMISEENVERILSQIFRTAESHKIPATFFELTTMLAFLYFCEEDVEIAVVETGLGGRLDATNILTPLLSIITSISYDHTDILGDTLEKITHEKGGIIKKGIPVVAGPTVSPQYLQPILEEKKSPITCIKGIFPTFEEENRAIARQALTLLKLPKETIEKGLQLSPPCRFERCSSQDREIILDVAHNPDGLKRLGDMLAYHYPQRNAHVIFGLSSNKDVDTCLKLIKDTFKHFHIVRAPNGRGVEVSDLQLKLEHLGVNSSLISTYSDIPKALINCIEQVKDELIVVCGTFFIMHPIRQYLGLPSECDPLDLNEKPHIKPMVLNL